MIQKFVSSFATHAPSFVFSICTVAPEYPTVTLTAARLRAVSTNSISLMIG